jgi:hypothetical protein
MMMQPARAEMPEFEVWAELAKTDPERFEALRLETIDDFIASVPGEDRRQQLRRLQWRIDRVRERSSNPLAACIALSRMMWDSFSQLREQYQGLHEAGQGRSPHGTPTRQAQILAFRPRAEVEG